MGKKNELPRGWCVSKLSDICIINPGKADLGVMMSDEDSCVFVPMASIKEDFGGISTHERRPWGEIKKGYTQFRQGDILFAKITPCMENGKLAIVPPIENGYGYGSTEFHVLRPDSGVHPRWIAYLLSQVEFRRNARRNMTGSAGQLRVPVTWLEEQIVIIPPYPEQLRILSTIDELFSELDKGIESLNAAKQRLQVFRKAVLQWAFEGKLTEKWRKVQKHLPKCNDLLNQLSNDKQSKEKSVGIKHKSYKPLSQNELQYSKNLPEGWLWIRLGDITWSVKDGPHYSPKYEENGVPFISGGNVRPNGVDFTNVKYISMELHEQLSKKCLPEYGDILYTKGGTTGIARVNTYGSDFNVWVHVAVLKLLDSVLPFYVQHCLNSPNCHKQSQIYTHGVGNQDLGLTRMINIIMPFCSIEEQKEIVLEIESRLSVCDNIEEIVDYSLAQAEALRHSILRKAFTGKLIPQDPNDEPTYTLVAKTQATRELGRTPKSRKGRLGNE